jgi:leader peptidase (prepilin peptidase)/N-methyltransferase
MLLYVWIVPLVLWLFVLGAAVGSFLNVCIYRTSHGKSLVWPGSRCGRCCHEVRLRDNIPLVSYWVLRGRCRDCGATFSMRYFWVELLTAVTFVALYLLEIGANVQHLTAWPESGFAYLEWGHTPPYSWGLFVFHAALACFLITAAGCLIDRGRVPPGVTVTGLLIGLLGAALFPWPFPNHPGAVLAPAPGTAARLPYFTVDGGKPARPLRGAMPVDASWSRWPVSPRPGFYPWPVWGPPPDFLPPGSCQLGLATGLAGALVGGWGVRLVGGVMRQGLGRPALSDAAADVGAIGGAFLGWQPAVIALLIALAVAVVLWAVRRRAPPFGPGLLLGIVAAWLGWAWIGPLVRPILFSAELLPPLLAAVLLLLYVVCVLVRWVSTWPLAARRLQANASAAGRPS